MKTTGTSAVLLILGTCLALAALGFGQEPPTPPPPFPENNTATCSGFHTFFGTNWTVSWAVNGSNITFTMFGPADGWIGIALTSNLSQPFSTVVISGLNGFFFDGSLNATTGSLDPDEKPDAVLLRRVVDPQTNFAIVNFSRPLVTSDDDDEDLDRPLYLSFSYGPFDVNSPIPIGPPNGTSWINGNPIQFDCSSTCNPVCQNGGVCNLGSCVCSLGFTGQYCQEFSMYCNGSGIFCFNGGSCNGSSNSCICPPGYSGSSCEYMACPSVCLNGGNCSTYGYCICPFGYTGQFCETRLTVCGNNTICYNNATCENGRCVCSGPYTGYNCSTEICDPPCQNNASCYQGRCSCSVAFTGETCETALGVSCGGYYCFNNGSCVNGSYCQCVGPYSGPYCDNIACDPPCQNGSCYNGTCSCYYGYTGLRCETQLEFCGFNSSYFCYNGGSCVNGLCVCQSPYSGFDCTSYNGSTSSPPTDFTSPPTSIPSVYCNGSGIVCYNGGSCNGSSYSCICPSGFSGSSCEYFSCPSMCLNGGNCSIYGYCNCPFGFTGQFCETRLTVCSNNTICYNNATCENGRCVCSGPYTGYNCSTEICDPPCQNNASCYQGRCSCSVAFTGETCETALGVSCGGYYCFNSGSCVNGSYCQCVSPYSGPYCDNIACDPPCQNGSCYNGTCSCYYGYTGLRCDTPLPTCGGTFCYNDGVCINGSCQCRYPYTGFDCTGRINTATCSGVQKFEGTNWTVSWEANGSSITFTMFGPADGWIGIGFTSSLSQPFSTVVISGPFGFFFDGSVNAITGSLDPDEEPDAVLLRRVVDPQTNFAIVNFSRPLVTSDDDDEDLDRPLYLSFSYGPFDVNSSIPIVDPGTNRWFSRNPIQFGCNSTCNPVCQNGGVCNLGSCVCPLGFTGQYCQEFSSCFCLNGGSCITNNITNSSTCVCQPGYTGQYCEQPLCTPECENGGMCVSGQCFCQFGFSGEACETSIFPPCGDYYCFYNSTCDNDTGSCVCPLGLTGRYCQDIQTCFCVNGGSCIGNSSICVCPPGFSGQYCEQQIACPAPCQNNGTCYQDVCLCLFGFTGEACEIPPGPPCGDVYCFFGGTCNVSTNVCDCPPPLAGDYCLNATGCFCLNNGSCNSDGVCECPDGFTGELCEQAVCDPPCQNGFCYRNRCLCNFPWTGDACDECNEGPLCRMTNCGNFTCLNQGVCDLASQSCFCPSGFTGRYCENELPTEEPTVGPTEQPSFCFGNYTFVGSNWTVFWAVNGSNIIFGMYGPRDGWIGIGFSEVQGGLQSISDLYIYGPGGFFIDGYINAQGMPALDLQQDASIVNVYSLLNTSYVYVSFTRPLETSDDVDLDDPWYLYYAYGPFDSTSPTGPVGDPGSNLWVSAERIQFDCEPICPRPCSNGGECFRYDGAPFDIYGCDCQSDYVGESCDFRSCEGRCMNGGTCTDGYYCLCPVGYSGVFCEMAVPFCGERNELICSNNGTCVDNACVCRMPFTGVNCTEEICDPVCQNNRSCYNGVCSCGSLFSGTSCENAIGVPCGNNKYCFNGGSCVSGSCACMDSYTGDYCQYMDCDPPCQNGDCVNGESYAYCECEFGYDGTSCENRLEVCGDLICQNGGSCVNGACSCPPQYTGRNCSIEICDSPCLNGGYCFNQSCICKAFYTGAYCDIALCPEDEYVCNNGGRCTDGSDRCLCPPGFKGEFCQETVENVTCTRECMNGGRCISGECYCPVGFVGAACEIDSALCREKYTFEGTNWTVSWAVAGSNITFAMFGPADGWIGVGFTSSLSKPFSTVVISGLNGYFFDGFVSAGADALPIQDEEPDAVLLRRVVDPQTNFAFVNFIRPLVTSDESDDDLDRPLYMTFSYGPFLVNSPLPIGPPNGTIWLSGNPIQFDCSSTCTRECMNGGRCISGECYCPVGFVGAACEIESALCRDSYTFEGTNWTVSWAVAGSNITFAMFGPADGWIGVGFTSSLSQPFSTVVISGLNGYFFDGFVSAGADALPIQDEEPDAVLLRRVVDPQTNFAFVNFIRPLVTSDESDDNLDRPLYMTFSYGPFVTVVNSPLPIGPPNGTIWLSGNPIQFDCSSICNPVCQNGGSCVLRRCVCPPGISGEACERLPTTEPTTEPTTGPTTEPVRVCRRVQQRIDQLNDNFDWPETAIGEFASIQCPCTGAPDLTKDLFAIRVCGDGGRWQATDYSVCVSDRTLELCEGGDLTNTLFSSLNSTDSLAPGDVAVLFSATSTLLTNEAINNETARDALLNAFDSLLSVDDNVLETTSATTGAGDTLLTAFDRIGDALNLVPRTPFKVTRTRFDLEFVELDFNNIPDEGYGTRFGGPDDDEVNLPKSLFNGYTSNPTISGSLVKQTSLFRGRDTTISISSSVLSISVLQNEVKDLEEPVTMKLKKTAPTPSGMEATCRFLDKSENSIGKWSTSGCQLMSETDTEVNCACDHLSSFAIILAPAAASGPAASPVAAIVVPIVVGLLLIAVVVVAVVAVVVFYLRSSKKSGKYSLAPTASAEEKQIALECVENQYVENADSPPATKEEEALKSAVNPLAVEYAEGEMNEEVTGKDEPSAAPEAEKETPLTV